MQNLVVEREQRVEIARKEQEILVAKGEIDRKKQELEGSVLKPASAAAYKLTQEAEAKKFATEKEAEAKAAVCHNPLYQSFLLALTSSIQSLTNSRLTTGDQAVWGGGGGGGQVRTLCACPCL